MQFEFLTNKNVDDYYIQLNLLYVTIKQMIFYDNNLSKFKLFKSSFSFSLKKYFQNSSFPIFIQIFKD